MARGSYLFRRDGTYYARIDVPTDLVPTLGKETLKKSLRTKVHNEAKRLVLQVVSEWHGLFAMTRARIDLSANDREHAVWDHYNSVLGDDEAERAIRPSAAAIEVEKERLYRAVNDGEIKGIDALSMLDATLDLQAMQKPPLCLQEFGEQNWTH